MRVLRSLSAMFCLLALSSCAGEPADGDASAEDVARVKAPLMMHYAGDDERVNAMRPEFEAALKEHGVTYEMHIYPGTRHGFHNYSTPRYDPEAASLAWQRTVAFFHEQLD